MVNTHPFVADGRAFAHNGVVGDLDGPCNVEAIRILENGVRMAGSDPRRDGWALAY